MWFNSMCQMNNYTKGSVLVRGAIFSYISIFLSIILSFFYTPWIIKEVGTSNYGLYTLATTFIGYFVVDFGMSASVTRYIARYRAENRFDKIEDVLGLAFKIFLAIDIILFLVLLIAYPFLKNIFTGLTGDELATFKILYLIAGLSSILSFFFYPTYGAMTAFEYFAENKLIDIYRRLCLVVMIFMTLIFHGNVIDLILVNGIVGLSFSFFRFLFFKKKSRVSINWACFDKIEIKRLCSYSGWVILFIISQRFRIMLIPTILGVMCDSTEISIFALGMSFEGVSVNITTALNGLFFPKVTRMSVAGDLDRVNGLMTKVGRVQLYVVSLIFFGFILFGRDFLHLWVGDDFQSSYIVIILLIFPLLITSTQSVAYDYINAENQVRYSSSFSIISATIALICSLLLASKYGAIGCAFAFCAGMLLYHLLLNIFLKNNMKLDVGQFFKECHLKILPAIIFFCISVYMIIRHFSIESWFSLMLILSVFIGLYSILSYKFLFNQSEKDLIHYIAKR